MFHDGLGAVTVLLPDAVEIDMELARAGAIALPYDTAAGLRGAVAALADIDVVSVLVEAGPRLFSALLADDLVDELVVLHAGGFAGEDAPALFVGESQDDPATLDRPLRAVEAAVIGDDAVTVWRPRRQKIDNV
jgi:riboflavin biosynthesis pyrimidine reductase